MTATTAEHLHHFGGRVPLALVNSVLWRGSDEPRDLVDTYVRLLELLEEVGALPAAQAAALRAAAEARPAEARAERTRVLALREPLFRAFSALAAGRAVAADDLAAVNAAVREAAAHA